MKYKHALFLNSRVGKTNTTTMGLFPPTGLEYVATSAKDLVGKATVIDLTYERKLSESAKLMDFIRREIDLICVCIGWNRQFEEGLELLNQMPDDIPLVVGGYKATEKVEEIFNACPKVDIIARGEAEETIKEIVKGVRLENILGISYRKAGRVIHNANRPLPDVNSIVPPDRSLRRYKYSAISNGVKLMSATFDTVLSSRGCPYNCKFCSFNFNPLGQKRTYAARKVESVIKEIEGISAEIILFSDDNFFTDPLRAGEICDAIIKRKIKKRFVAQARLDVAKHPELLAKASRAGFKILLVGIESPHDYILKAHNKGFDRAAIRRYFSVLRKYPIFYHGNYIYGNIGETEEEMMYIPKFSKELGVDSVAFSKLRADKYSPLKETLEKTPGFHVTERGEVYSDKFSHAALKKINRKMKFMFYTPFAIFKLLKKLLTIGFVTPRDILTFLVMSPVLLVATISREMYKNRLGDSIKRAFIKNA